VGASDAKQLSDWCARWVGSGVVGVLFESGHLSAVTGVRLHDGREVVVKVRPSAERLTACVAVQAHLARSGFPCPTPIAGPAPFGEQVATAERLLPGGHQLQLDSDGAAAFAQLLAMLLRLAPRVDEVGPLLPSPPWVGWDHTARTLWPALDDRGRDLNAFAGPNWLDDAAGRVRQALIQADLPPVVGHGDFESQNIRWNGIQVLAVDDWDSAVAQPECAVVGAAAAVWASRGGPGEASDLAQTRDFISAYRDAAVGRRDERWERLAWAAGLWIRLFNAKKDALDGGGPQLELIEQDYGDRLSLAGLG
jgi:Ser/Thr protein kinase RdoA (MazF antagonist)